MDIESLLTLISVIGLFFVTIYVANMDDVQAAPFTRARFLLYAIAGILFLFGLTLLSYAFIDPTRLTEIGAVEIPTVDRGGALFAAIISFSGAVFSLQLIGNAFVRQWTAGILRGGTFNPDSTVHTAALILSLTVLCINVGQLVLSGGITGLADSYEQSNVVSDAFLQQALWIFASFLGVGLFIRRTTPASLSRLGLRFPTRQDFKWGISAGIGMLMFVYVMGVIWSLIVPPEQLAEQTAAAEQISAALGTIPLALVVSLLVAVGEEIFFRGALQPIFGVAFTSIYFALLHIQYTLTPASLAILILGIVLGVLRSRASTTSAIIAHFVYNFSQLALAIFAASMFGA